MISYLEIRKSFLSYILYSIIPSKSYDKALC